ncbi:MAG: heme exporter protein CcmB [Proteobacteria bacterium]|nr:heme exporter protein CcmB [Pseudomonadota bacterium]MCH8322695.1 heme exporter protein CcmB [Pseudomonadota bacterium]
MKAFLTLVRLETLSSWRQGGAGMLVVMFYVMTVSLFPFGVGPDPAILSQIGAGIVWVAALLSAILSLDRMFSIDFEDGSMDLLALTAMPLEIQVIAKALSHWLNSLGPVILATPLLALVLQIGTEGLIALILTMLIGTPALSFMGAIAAALTASIKRGGVLIPLLVLPLYIPTLIFGAGAVAEVLAGTGGETGNLLFLGALSTFSFVIGPIAAAAALRTTME